MSSYHLTPEGLAELSRYLHRDTLFAFDLDGTLAPIADDRSGIKIPEQIRNALQRLMVPAKVLILTGRSRQNALAILGFEPQLVLGNHGAEWPDDETGSSQAQVQQCRKWREQLHERLRHLDGVDIEYKELSLAVHYRKAEDQEGALGIIEAAVRELDPEPRVIGGKYVLNLLTKEAMTKGGALLAAMRELRCERAVYFGDDVTDEEVFHLEGNYVLGVHIGEGDETAAAFHLKSQSEIAGVMWLMVRKIEALPG